MQLKEFIVKSLTDIIDGIEEVRSHSVRDLSPRSHGERSTVEFDIAVATENNQSGNGKAGIQVLQFIEAGGSIGEEIKNSTVSRIKFGVEMESLTKVEQANRRAQVRSNLNQINPF